MKEKIYTIPINDAYSSDCACPMCLLRDKIENDCIDYYLGPSLMEPDTRKQTNKYGFCPEHLAKLYGQDKNRLGLGLMLHTHLSDLRNDIGKKALTAAPAKGGIIKGRDGEYKSKLLSLADSIDTRTSQCVICEKIDSSIQHYADVILWMFSHDSAFREKFSEKKQHCLPHTSLLLRRAAVVLTQSEASEFVPVITSGLNAALAEIGADVEWFTLKFDYRNKDKSWGNSKNALPRTIDFLGGQKELYKWKTREKIT